MKEETITHQFKDSRDSGGNGYSGYLDESCDLVLVYNVSCYHDVYYRGPYATAGHQLGELRSRDKVLYDDIEKYFSQKHAKAKLEKFKRDCGWEEETKTILFKVRLFMDSHEVHNCLVRGRFQAAVIKKLMPASSEVLTLQTFSGNVFAVHSEKISAIEFVED